MAVSKAKRPRPKVSKNRYHHGDLRRALLEEADRRSEHAFLFGA